MQPHYHAIVWIDHLQAKVFHIGLTGTDQIDLHPHLQTRHIHHKANSIGSGHVHEDRTESGWINGSTGKPIDVSPTHWRWWPIATYLCCCG